MKKIILDTNFLLLPLSKNIDIFSEIDSLMYEPYRLFIIKESLDELKSIIKTQKGKHKQEAKLALQLIKKKGISIFKQKHLNMPDNSKNLIVDDIILECAGPDTIVATQDKELKKKLIKKGINIIYLKNKKLEIKDVL